MRRTKNDVPFCAHCRLQAYEHVQGHCLYGPSEYKAIRCGSCGDPIYFKDDGKPMIPQVINPTCWTCLKKNLRR